MSKSSRKPESNLQQWLNQFSNEVDYKRFQRGMTLYNDQRIGEFKIYPNHYECVVKGNQANYVLYGYFQLENGVPRLDDYEVKCGCPDDAGICKHAVCATMFFILDQLGKEDTDSTDSFEDARDKLIEVPLRDLQKSIENSNDSVLTLHNQRGIKTIDNKEFVETVHERIVNVIDELKSRNA